jgi:BirA family biotin operon repressor/biotin-[acetyl-CoA-carboxylase] ligase
MTQTTIKIIEVLKKQEWISGEQLAKDLNISRTAIWKHINQLKKKGYQITAKPNQGYHLIKPPEKLTVEEIKHQLKTEIIGKNIYHLASVSSTNDYAKKLAKENEPEGTLVIADQQTGGRGRKQRTWFSPEKGLWFSLILRPKLAPNEAMQATMCAACAVIEGIMQQTKLHPTIKWPNDILVNNKKVCGILTELAAEIDEITYLIVGIGINVNNALQEELKKISTTLQIENKKSVDSIGLLSDTLFSFENLYTELTKGNSTPIRERWMKYSSTIGSKVSIRTEKEMVTGTAIGIGKHGELIVKTKKGKKSIITGDITYLE